MVGDASLPSKWRFAARVAVVVGFLDFLLIAFVSVAAVVLLSALKALAVLFFEYSWTDGAIVLRMKRMHLAHGFALVIWLALVILAFIFLPQSLLVYYLRD